MCEVVIPTPDSYIQFQGVSFGWNEQKLLFIGFDCTIPLDKVIVLTGENGSGKSTFAALAAGISKPTTGIISWQDIASDTKQINRIYKSLSFLQQKTEMNLVGVDAESDLHIWAMSHSGNKDISNRIEDSLKYWGLADIRHRPVWELSSGELKRLCLAGLNLYPERYWVLDEPEAGLDSGYCVKLISAIKEKAKHNNGALIITHKPDLYKDFYDEFWQINPNGSISMTNNGAI